MYKKCINKCGTYNALIELTKKLIYFSHNGCNFLTFNFYNRNQPYIFMDQGSLLPK